MHGRQEVLHELEKGGNLPTLPNILLKILTICNENDIDLDYLATTIGKDPAVCTEVLRLVNSAYYGLHQPAKTIKQAVVYLGSKTIQNMVAVMAIHHTFKGERFRGQEGFDAGAFWYHSLMCATLGKRICDAVSGGNGDEVYLAGLLHDIGKLILVSSLSPQYSPVIASGETGSTLVVREEDALGINHCEVGSWLVRQWKMNPLIADAILYHHYPLEQIREGLLLTKIVYAANMLLGEEKSSEERYADCTLLLGLEYGDVEQILLDTQEEVRNVAEQMGIVAGPGDSVSVPKPQQKSDTASLEAGQDELSGQVKKLSLLAPVFDNLLLASDVGTILAALEKSLNLLFGIDKTLCLLPDASGLLLEGGTSGSNPLHQISKGIRLPIKKSSSAIVRCYTEMSTPTYLAGESQHNHLADVQILNFFDADSLLLVSLAMDGEPVGVIVAKLSGSKEKVEADDLKLIETVSRQVAIRLHLENQKVRAAEKLQAEKMAAVSLAARKLAHEINNPLGIISNCLAGIKLMMADRGELQDDLQIIDEEIHRISAMVSQMEMFSQAPFTEFNETDINSTVNDIVQLTRSSLFDGPAKTLTFVPGANLPLVTTSENAIKQILINLIKNAAEAMQQKGRVVVRTKLVTGTEDKDGERIEIIVADTGPGLPEQVQANLYQPLITTKENGHSGLGLSIVHKAVKDLGATLSCTSSENEGTSFTVSLPTSLSQSSHPHR